VSDSLLQFQSAFFVQVHAWVTAMSLKSTTLQPWETLKYHPVVTVPIERSKRPQPRSLQAPSKRLSLTPSASKPAHPTPSNKAATGRSNQKQQSLSVALHANASSLLPNTACPLQDGLCPESAAWQSSQLETYILCLPWGPAGQFFMLGTNTIHLQ